MSDEDNSRRRWSGPGEGAAPASGRHLTKREPVRKKSLGKSSRAWVERQLADPYVQRAREQGYRARAVFKLKELDEKFDLLRRGARVLDLGCAPGGWMQAVLEKGAARVVGVDLLPVDPLEGAIILQGDILDPEMESRALAELGGLPTLVLSDMAADTTGHRQTDHLRTVALAEAAARIAVQRLERGGAFVAKVFQGGAEAGVRELLKERFDQVRHWKPPASRPKSPETYVVATGFRG